MDRAEANLAVVPGRPVIRGTHIPIEVTIRKLSEGATEADLPYAYPRLTQADTRAALTHAVGSLACGAILLQSAYRISHKPGPQCYRQASPSRNMSASTLVSLRHGREGLGAA